MILKSKNKIFTNMKKLFLIKNININKLIVSNKVSFGKKSSKYLIDYKDAKKSNLYAYFFQKQVYIEKTLMKLKTCFFW